MRILKPRCNKPLPKGGICNLPLDHPQACQNVNRIKNRLQSSTYSKSHVQEKNATKRAWRKAHPDKYHAINRAEHAAEYKAHPTRVLQRNAAWVRRNPKTRSLHANKRRATKVGATTEPFTKAQYIARMADLGNACYYGKLLGLDCSHECNDHFYPLQPKPGYKPGPHALKNLVPCCRKHNSQKHNKQPMDFINKLLEAS